MRLQETYKPEDYNELIKDFKGEIYFPISSGTLSLICNHFEKLPKQDRKKVKKLLLMADLLDGNIKLYQKHINDDEKVRFKKELEIIEIFQRNNI